MPSIGIIIVNYKAHRLTSRCITSIKNNCRGDLRFIVVDNSPINEINLVVMDHPEIVTIVPETNLGFAGGCNYGIAYALSQNFDYILLLNPDTWAEHDFIGTLRDALEKDGSRAMAGPTIFWDNDRRDIWYGGAKMNWWLGGPVQVRDRRQADGPVQVVPFLSGCAMLIKASALKTVGPMAEEYFLYYEDIDFGLRFIQAGFTLVYVPAAKLIHEASSTVGFQSRDYVYYFSRNRIWLMRRWSRWYQFLVFMIYNTFVKLPGALIVFGLLRRKPELTVAYFKGYWHGIVNFEKTPSACQSFNSG